MDLALQLLLNGLCNGSHYALLGIGFGLIFGTTGVVHFAYGPVYALGGYLVWSFAGALGLPLLPAIALGVAATGLIDMAVYLGLYRPFLVRQAPTFVVLVASLGFFIVLTNLLGIVFGTSVRSLPDVSYGIYFLGNVVVTAVQLIQVGALAVVACGLSLFLRLTRWGAAIRAVTDNPEMARIVGIDTERVSLLCFALGSAISVIPASLILLKDGVLPNIGFGAIFFAFIAVVVGGVGSIRGAALGGLLLGLVESLGTWQLPSEWQSTISFLVLFLVVLCRPTGLFKGN